MFPIAKLHVFCQLAITPIKAAITLIAEIDFYDANNNILYESQYSFKDCRNTLPLPFDFYLTDYNVCIEYDGRQHYKVNDFFGGEEAFEKLKINDAIKSEYCKNNNIKRETTYAIL